MHCLAEIFSVREESIDFVQQVACNSLAHVWLFEKSTKHVYAFIHGIQICSSYLVRCVNYLGSVCAFFTKGDVFHLARPVHMLCTANTISMLLELRSCSNSYQPATGNWYRCSQGARICIVPQRKTWTMTTNLTVAQPKHKYSNLFRSSYL